ncbi:hypothetical protein LWI28_007473 [Acer negundo]|uniref:Uncharacterized protein n=1 Tax=Acer negundo TaxID=4023 RepID=A0AAD5JDL5_ACENE|nr:hypothetical protein LWI28_007473 [Acer negundo]
MSFTPCLFNYACAYFCKPDMKLNNLSSSDMFWMSNINELKSFTYSLQEPVCFSFLRDSLANQLVLQEVKKRLTQLERWIGEPPDENITDLALLSVENKERVIFLQQSHANLLKDLETRFNTVRMEQASVVDGMVE